MATLELEAGGKLHYIVDDYTDPWRRAEWIFMHHRMGGSARSWYAWIPHLARRYKVIRVDPRGHGESTPPPAGSAVRLDTLTGDVIRILDHLGIERVHFVGASGGSMIGQYLALTHPSPLRSLTLVSPLPGLPPKHQDHIAAKITRDGLRGWMNEERDIRFKQVDPQLVDWYVKSGAGVDPALLQAITAAARTVDLSSELHRIGVPTLILSAGADGLNADSVRRQMGREIPRLEYVIIEGRRHNIVASAADDSRQAAVRFPEPPCLARVSPRGGKDLEPYPPIPSLSPFGP